MKYIISIALLMGSFSVFSCDVCGISVSPGMQGLLPNNRYHFFGIRANYNSFQSSRPILLSDDFLTSKEHFFRSTLFGRWQISERFDLNAAIPFVYNEQHINGHINRHQGIGDIRITTNFLAINKTDSTSNHLFRVGAGAKLPTGNYSRDAWQTSNLYTGTGSYDFVLSSNYTLNKQKWGIIQDNQFWINTENKAGYRYGNSLNSRLLFQWKPTTKGKLKINPFAGAGYQWSMTDRIDGIHVSQQFNGGHLVTIEGGLQFMSNNWMTIIRYAHPVVQQLSNGDVRAIIGNAEIGISYLIQKK